MRGYERDKDKNMVIVTDELFLPMRGYERYKKHKKFNSNKSYFFPWGVMSHHPPLVLCTCPWLFLPMRGYECEQLNEGVPWVEVISSHEGLWAEFGKTLKGTPHRVISSHEGLWEKIYQTVCPACHSYFFPWGVMRLVKVALIARLPKLFLPMRGYECEEPEQLALDIHRYFFPWGVMSHRLLL